jgi:hypothetical protein
MIEQLTDEECDRLARMYQTPLGRKALAERAAMAAVIERVRAVVENCAIHIDVVTMGHLRNALAGAGAPDTYERGIRDASGRIIEPQLTAEQACERLTRDLAAANARIAELEAGRASDDRDYRARTAALNAALARAEVLHAELAACGKERDSALGERNQAAQENEALRADLNAANARADAAERDKLSAEAQANDWKRSLRRAESEAASLREHLRVQTAALAEDLSTARAETASLRQLVTELRASFAAQCEKTTERAAEAASLRAECEERRKVDLQNCKLIDRLHAELTHAVAMNDKWAKQAYDDRTSLAAATELLEQLRKLAESGKLGPYATNELMLALANAPAAPTMTVHHVWAALGELTSLLVDGEHVLRVDDVRRVFEQATATAPQKTLEMRMAELGLHHIGESRADVEKRLANAPAAPTHTEGCPDESQREVCLVRPVGGSVLGPQEQGPLRMPAADAARDLQQVAPTRTDHEAPTRSECTGIFPNEPGCSYDSCRKRAIRADHCDECGTIHGPGNTNTLCSKASNYRGLGHSAWNSNRARTGHEQKHTAGVRRWAMDCPRMEMFEIAKGAYVLYSDYERAMTRANHELAVLDAMGAIEIGVLEAIRDGWSCAPPIFHPPCLAELARREAEK